MAKAVEMPRMGYDMTEGKIQRWIKQEGDTVSRGDAIAEIETDKVNIEIEAFESGVLKKIIRQAGEMVQVGAVIAVIGEADEQVDLAALGIAAPASNGGQAAPAPEPAAPPAESPAPSSTAPATATATAATTAPAAATAPAPAATGEVQRLTAPSMDRLRVSPVARRLAEQHGVDLANVTGSGPGGRIVKNDVETYRQQAPAEAPAPTTTPAPVAPVAAAPAAPVPAPAGAREVALSRMRQAIARVTVQSKQQAPHFYLSVEVNMDAALAVRQQLNDALEGDGVKLSVNDLVVKATAKALAKHSYMNATFAGDKLIVPATVDVGIAVALDEGLITPVIRNADIKSISTISQETRDLAGRARTGGLRPEEYSGGTFSISNLGMFGIDDFIAIIVPPQAGILAIGNAVKRPVVLNDELAVATTMRVTLSADHRVTDGAQAAVFLKEIQRLLEAPMLLLA